MEVDIDLLNKNATYMKSLIGLKLEVKTIENKLLSGTVYVIDPVSKTVCLTTTQDNGTKQLDMILFPSIKSITCLGNHCEEEYLFKDTTQEYDTEVLQNKKLRLKDWLNQNMLDVEEDGYNLKYQDLFVIEPPYNVENCLCNNTIILDRIQNIVKKLPS